MVPICMLALIKEFDAIIWLIQEVDQFMQLSDMSTVK